MIDKLKTQNSKLKTTAGNLKFCVLSFSLALCILCSTLGSAFAQTVSSTELINRAKDYDGRTVSYSGEVIGDIMVRGGHAWINVGDGENAIGVWLDKNLIKDIKYTGSYKSRGDWIQVSGVFHRACSQHGGDLDIHAQNISIVNPGRPIKHYLSLGKINLTIILFGVLSLVWISKQLKAK